MLTRRALLRTALWLPPALVLPTACGGARPGVTAQLDHGLPAALGGTMTFTLTASSVWNAPDPAGESGMTTTAAEVFFGMTAGLTPLNLDDQWAILHEPESIVRYSRQVTFTARTPQVFELQVHLDQEGEQRLGGGTRIMLQESSATDSQIFYLLVSASGTQVQDTPFSPPA